jgi:hypothetical protein
MGLPTNPLNNNANFGASQTSFGRWGKPRGLRWQSSTSLLEYPLVAVAVGPDPANNETRGHARGIIAIGDLATGVIALGAVARGLIALGGLAIGGLAVGGCGIGVLGFGGLALGYAAVGGLAIGYAAIGGLAVGYYAIGGLPIGKYVIGPLQRDPQAVEFFAHFWQKLLPAGTRTPR